MGSKAWLPGDATPPPPPPPRRRSMGKPETAEERLLQAAKVVEIPPVLPAPRPGAAQWRAAVWPISAARER